MPKARTNNRPDTDWYKTWFDEEYTNVYRHRDSREAETLIELIQKTIQRNPISVLDLCCGNGRHAIALARRGYRVSGLDLSEKQIRDAKSLARRRRVKIRFFRADMRSIPTGQKYDLIVNFFTSFGYFHDDRDNKRVLKSVYRALKPGGWFVLDYMNSTYVKKKLVPRSTRRQRDRRITEKRWIENRRVNKSISIRFGGVEKQYLESVRLYSTRKLRNMLHDAHLVIRHKFGTYSGAHYVSLSPRVILFAQKR